MKIYFILSKLKKFKNKYKHFFPWSFHHINLKPQSHLKNVLPWKLTVQFSHPWLQILLLKIWVFLEMRFPLSAFMLFTSKNFTSSFSFSLVCTFASVFFFVPDETITALLNRKLYCAQHNFCISCWYFFFRLKLTPLLKCHETRRQQFWTQQSFSIFFNSHSFQLQ